MFKRIKDKKILFILLFVCISCFFIIGYIFISYEKKPYIINDKYSFSEVNDVFFDFTDKEIKNINEVLENRKIENDNYFGFVSENTKVFDMYTTNGVVKLGGLFNKYGYQKIKNEFKFIGLEELYKMDILNLIYYMEVCNELGIKIDYNVINDALDKFYDSESMLFFVDSINDSFHIKLIITSMCKKAMGENLSLDSFQLEKGIRRVYEDYEFQTNQGESFYNSGADIIYCYSLFDIVDELNDEEIAEWYSFWKKEYESTEIKSLMDALCYSEYLNVANILEQNYSVKKLNDYYINLNTEELTEFNDLFAIYNILKNIEVLDNDNVNKVLKSKIDNALKNNELFDMNIDVKSTAIGVIIAKQTGYELDYKKLKNYINFIYDSIDQINEIYTKIEVLYYNIILDQQINDFEQEYNAKWLQKQVNLALNKMKYKDNIVSDIIVTRRIVEIVSDLQMFNVDIFLTNSQVNRIKNGVKSACKDDMFKCSLICELYLLDNILSLDVLDEDKFYEIYNELDEGSGVKCVKDNNIVADMMTTYQFNICFERIGDNYNYIKGKDFAKSLNIKEGIYKMNDSCENEVDLNAILYGNILINMYLGEKFSD